MMRERTSRPNSSVPNQCDAEGPIKPCRKIDVSRILGRNPWREERAHHEDSDQHNPRRRQQVVAGGSTEGCDLGSRRHG